MFLYWLECEGREEDRVTPSLDALRACERVFQPMFYVSHASPFIVQGVHVHGDRARQVVPACYLYSAEFPYADLASWVISGGGQGLRLRLRRYVSCSVAVMTSDPCALYLPQQYGAVREVLRRSGVVREISPRRPGCAARSNPP